MEQTDTLVEIRRLCKSFSGVYVLTDIDFDLREGEVHALVGENGAGKSTFIKILSGAYARDSGAVSIGGREIPHLNPQIAQDLGIVTIYQDRNLVPYLSVAENILIADEPRGKLGFIQWRRLYRRVEEICTILNLPLRPRDVVADLSAAQQQMVEIAKALYKNARVVIMDEPTASLTRVEITHLFDLIKRLKEQAISVIYISHRLDEIFAVSERVTVLRDGRKVGTFKTGSIDRTALVKAMVGEELRLTRVGEIKGNGTLLQVDALTRKGQFEDISITLRNGEIIGVAGMVGSGRTEVVRALTGLVPVDKGRILFRGEDITRKPFSEYIRKGICLLPEERDLRGLISSMSVSANITLASLKKISKGPFLRLLHERKVAAFYVESLNIATRGVHQEVQFLSGGNRQKVMIAKWLCLGTELFLMDEPTQGVDVGAREEIHRIMLKSIEDGKAVIMVTSDLDELMNMSHRIMVMNKGRVAAWLTTSQTTQEEVLSFAIGKTG